MGDSDSLDIMIGQMVMVGFRGLEAPANVSIREFIAKGMVGGVVLFDYDVERASPVRNIASPAQLRRLIRSLQKGAPVPLFIAIDQEGGRVNRLKTKFGFPPTVSQQYLGKLDNPDTTRAYARRAAELLSSLGVNVNFAPVLDLASNPGNPVIARLERSYSPDPAVVTRHARIVLESMRASGILCAVKHFPGHGSSSADSHEGFTDVSDTWNPRELLPFADAIREGTCDMVMTAHIFNRTLDAQLPATLSPATIGRLLRDSLGWHGLVVSDDMNMKAIAAQYGFETAVRQAIAAGVDILLFGNNIGGYDERIAEKAAAAIRRLVDSGAIDRGRIESSFRRIMLLKAKLKR